MKYSDKLTSLKPSASMKLGLVENRSKSINLGIGVSDLETIPLISEIINKLITANKYPYTPSGGTSKAKHNMFGLLFPNCITYNDSCFMLVNGAKWGISLALSTICNSGDKVVLMEPYWLGYPSICQINNLTTISWLPRITNSGELNFEMENFYELIKKERPQAIILNNPNNPSGKVFSLAFISEIINCCNNNGIWVILDEVYRDLTFSLADRLNSESIYTAPNVIAIGSLSKSMSIPGLRLGYIRSNADFISKADLINQHLQTCTNSIANVIAENLNTEDYNAFTKYSSSIYSERYNIFSNLFQGDLLKSSASFYILACPKYGPKDGELICNLLAEKTNIICTPGINYGDYFKNYIRICLTLGKEELSESAIKINNTFRT